MFTSEARISNATPLMAFARCTPLARASLLARAIVYLANRLADCHAASTRQDAFEWNTTRGNIMRHNPKSRMLFSCRVHRLLWDMCLNRTPDPPLCFTFLAGPQSPRMDLLQLK